jgi:hypothetical protein
LRTKDKLFYGAGLLVGIVGLWLILQQMNPIQNVVIHSDLTSLKELTGFEWILGFGGVIVFLFLIIRSILLPFLYFMNYVLHRIADSRIK